MLERGVGLDNDQRQAQPRFWMATSFLIRDGAKLPFEFVRWLAA
jgi:hypothetical protein